VRQRLSSVEVGGARSRADTSGPIRFADEPSQPCCQGDELRCGCGSLLARLVGPAVELKCRRCKRVWTIPVERT
jgi:hypothetical protein